MTVQIEVAETPRVAELNIRARLLSQRYDTFWLAAGSVVITLVTFVFGLWGSGWHLAPPLDDTFIHMQYARQLVAGHPFQYNTGDMPSSGDSSFIYPFMLAPAYLIGLSGMKVLLYADLLNFIAHLAAALLFYNIGLRLGGRPLALLCAWFLLLDGRLNWMFLAGMETGIYTAALIGFFWLWMRNVPAGRLGALAVAGTFAALLRTEGHILISLVCVLTFVYLWRTKGFSWKYGWLVVPILAGLVPYAVNQVLTGYWQFNTALSKSIWYVPYWPLHEKLALTVGWGITAFKDVYLGLQIGRSPFPILAAPVAILGAAYALGKGAIDRNPTHRFLHILLITTFIASIGVELLLPPIHFYRYWQPYDFIFWLYLALGLVRLAGLVSGIRDQGSGIGDRELGFRNRSLIPDPRSLRLLTAAVAALCLPQLLAFLFDFSDSTRDIYYQQMTFSQWIKENTPADARIGVNDIGAHKYLGDRYILDLVGLADNSLRSAHMSGWGTIYDILMRLPKEQRPQYFLIHPDVAVNSDESVKQGFLEPFYSISIQNTTITAGPTETLYKVNWYFADLDQEKLYLLGRGKRDEDRLDELNVGDLADEQKHSYKTEARQADVPEPKAIVTSASYEKKGPVLTESGRRHSGWEQFTVKSQPGKPLTIVARAKLNPDADQTLMIWANGRMVGLWKAHNQNGGFWQEYEYTIPAQFITSDHTTIRMDATFDPGGPGFASYRYWFYTSGPSGFWILDFGFWNG